MGRPIRPVPIKEIFIIVSASCHSCGCSAGAGYANVFKATVEGSVGIGCARILRVQSRLSGSDLGELLFPKRGSGESLRNLEPIFRYHLRKHAGDPDGELSLYLIKN